MSAPAGESQDITVDASPEPIEFMVSLRRRIRVREERRLVEARLFRSDVYEIVLVPDVTWEWDLWSLDDQGMQEHSISSGTARSRESALGDARRHGVVYADAARAYGQFNAPQTIGFTID